MVTKAVFIDYSWERKKIGLTKCKDVSWCLLCSWGMVSRGHSAAAEGDESLSVCPHIPVNQSTHSSQSAPTSQSVCPHIPVNLPTHPSQSTHTSQSVCPHTTKDPTEKGNGSSALYLIIYSLFRRISASIAKTIVLTILRFLDFAFAR